jgi:hypothetical protein
MTEAEKCIKTAFDASGPLPVFSEATMISKIITDTRMTTSKQWGESVVSHLTHEGYSAENFIWCAPFMARMLHCSESRKARLSEMRDSFAAENAKISISKLMIAKEVKEVL